MLEKGEPPPADLKLPASVATVVDVDYWRERLFSDGVLDRKAANPRQDFKRLRDGLAARSAIGIHVASGTNGVAWRV
jgi:hypothetical protein